MAPTTRRQAALRTAEAETVDPSTSEVSSPAPSSTPRTVPKKKKPTKDATAPRSRTVQPKGSRVRKTVAASRKARKPAPYDPDADPRIGMKGFLPNGLPNTGHEVFVPGYTAGKLAAAPEMTTAFNPDGESRIGMKGFLPRGIPDTGNEVIVPGYTERIAGTAAGTAAAVEQMKNVATSDFGVLDVESLTNHTTEILKQTLGVRAEAVGSKETENKATLETTMTHTKSYDRKNEQKQVEEAPPISKQALDRNNPDMDPSVVEGDSCSTPGATHKPDAQARDIIEIPNASMPTLTNDIHDIWDRARHDHWRFSSQLNYNQDWRVYETLMPAIRLASQWLTQPQYQWFWTAILYGPAKLDEDEEHPFWNLGGGDTKTKTRTSKHHKDMERRLREIAQEMHFIFSPLDERRWAHTEAISKQNSRTWRRESFEPGYVTVLHDDFMYVPWPGAKFWRNTSTGSKLRFLFLLAVQLGGQLAEVLWLDRLHKERGDLRADDGSSSPRMVSLGGARYDSMSHAFEGVVLGGRLQLINDAPNPLCPDGLAITAVDPADASVKVKPISMNDINSYFSGAR